MSVTMPGMALERVAYGLIGDSEVGDEREREEDTLVEYPLRDKKGAKITLRLPARLVDYLGALASSNNRSLAAEIQVALEVHESLSRLAAVTDHETQQRLRDQSNGEVGVVGENADRFAEQLRTEVQRAWAGSFFNSSSRARRFVAELLGRDA